MKSLAVAGAARVELLRPKKMSTYALVNFIVNYFEMGKGISDG